MTEEEKLAAEAAAAATPAEGVAAAPATPATPAATPEAGAEATPAATAAVETAAGEAVEEVKSIIKSASTEIAKGAMAEMAKFAPTTAAPAAPAAGVVMAKAYVGKDNQPVMMEKSIVDNMRKWFVAAVQKDGVALREAAGELAKSDSLVQSVEIKEYLQKGTQNETTNRLGGYTAPAIILDILLAKAVDIAKIRPRATVINLAGPGETFEVPRIEVNAEFDWVSEGAAKPTTTIEFAQEILTPTVLSGIMKFSRHLLEDSRFDLVPWIIGQIGMIIAEKEDRAFAGANGSGKPKGINQYTVPTVALGTTLEFDDLVKMQAKMPEAYRSGAVWMGNNGIVAGLKSLKDSTGRPLVIGDQLQNTPASILGHEILENNGFANNELFLVNLSYYFIGDKFGVEFLTSEHATVNDESAFETNKVFLRAEKRVDGRLGTPLAAVEGTGLTGYTV